MNRGPGQEDPNPSARKKRGVGDNSPETQDSGYNPEPKDHPLLDKNHISPLVGADSNLKQVHQYVLFNYLDNESLSSFSLSCHQMAEWTKEHREYRGASRLLELVVQGNQDAAKVMLQSNPALIFSNKGRAIDYSGKRIQGLTAFQAALCAGDLEMCQMMKDVCATIENGQKTLQEQYKALFPDGIEAYSQEQAKNTFDFSDIIKAILHAPEVDVVAALKKEFDGEKPLHKALSIFRAAFDKLSYDTQIFNPWHLHQAFTLYDNNFGAAQSRNKRDLIWCQVVGYTQRHLPACYAQSFAEGRCYLVDQKEPLRRIFHFLYTDGAIFPLSSDADLGFDFATQGHLWRGSPPPDSHGMPSMETYFEQKHQSWSELFSPPRNRNAWCVVC